MIEEKNVEWYGYLLLMPTYSTLEDPWATIFSKSFYVV